ncbi:hypothetical protein MKZ38_003763 [Zalerion maritima]|uniref:Transcription factor Iwr1 domain-containing protein n=1 Tax=Zalerion maritima TaxID=339359 RepID=A0AAD5RNR8_9PEZI|nr:hypothetical protein MKZ38_003763 [Zalerion maritima]
MSVPPEKITVKRKRAAEETPLEFLRLGPSIKKNRSEEFVYQRHTLSPGINKPGSEEHPSARGTKIPRKTEHQRSANPEPTERRFFLKRRREAPDAENDSSSTQFLPDGTVLFVERVQKKCKNPFTSKEEAERGLDITPFTSKKITPGTKKYKKPSLVRKLALLKKDDIPTVATETPPENVIKDLEEWSLQEAKITTPPKRRFKPKPCKRYAERHPDYNPATTRGEKDKMDGYDSEDGSEDSYVLETYVRVSAHLVEKPSGPTVGMLVIEEGSDMEFFYDDEEESDYDFDDDDENGENYYANDYPEDEQEDTAEDEAFWSDDGKVQFGYDSDDKDEEASERRLNTSPWAEMYM